MGSVVTSLKKLYKKLGGDKAKGVNTIDGMVNKIAEKVNGGGSGSGGGIFLIAAEYNASPDPSDESRWSVTDVVFDKTFDEVKQAYESGMLPVVSCGIWGEERLYLDRALPTVDPTDSRVDQAYFSFKYVDIYGSNATTGRLGIMATYLTLGSDHNEGKVFVQ